MPAALHKGTQIVKLSESVKPISYLKAHTAEVLRDVSEGQRTMVITQHGEAKIGFPRKRSKT